MHNEQKEGGSAIFSSRALRLADMFEKTLVATIHVQLSLNLMLFPKTEKSCPKLAVPANGNVIPSTCATVGNVYQEQCSYTCSSGYRLSGVRAKTCLSSGQWDSQEDPTCQQGKPPQCKSILSHKKQKLPLTLVLLFGAIL